MKTTFIYTLNDPMTGAPRYVGKADDVDRRFKKHLYEATQEDTHKNRWLLKLRFSGLTPEFVVVSEVQESEWPEKEKEYIALLKATGFELTNGTEGGDGMSGYVTSDKTKAILREKRTGEKNPFFGRKHSEEFKESASIRMSGRVVSDETKERMSKHQKGVVKYLGDENPFFGKQHTAESKALMSASLTGRPSGNKGKKTGQVPWNKGKKTGQVPWNKGMQNGKRA